jgi:hypothetical protein
MGTFLSIDSPRSSLSGVGSKIPHPSVRSTRRSNESAFHRSMCHGNMHDRTLPTSYRPIRRVKLYSSRGSSSHIAALYRDIPDVLEPDVRGLDSIPTYSH